MAGPVQAMYHALPQEGSDSLKLELQDSCCGCWEQNAGLDLCMCIHICTCYDMVVGSEENTVEPESPSTMETQQWNSGFSQLQAAFLAEPSFWLLAIIY